MFLFARRFDLPLAEDATGRFLVWIIGVMVFLAMLAAAGALVLSDLAGRWETGLTGRLTVQISPVLEESARPGPGAEPLAPLPQRTELALALLRATPGVQRAQPVSVTQTRRLLEPWLGTSLPDELPLPALIDVEMVPGGILDVDALANRLAASVAGARLDNHAAWLVDLRRLSRTAQLVALAVLLLVGAAAVVAVVFAVRTGLAIHAPVVELLHIMGASDGYVARQFQSHVLELAVRGGLIGLALALTSLLALEFGAAGIQNGLLLPELALKANGWLSLTVVPMVIAALATLTARLTVLRALRALP